MELDYNTKKRLESEKELYYWIPNLKGIHGHYIADRNYNSIRNLKKAAEKIVNACHRIMSCDEYDRAREFYSK